MVPESQKQQLFEAVDGLGRAITAMVRECIRNANVEVDELTRRVKEIPIIHAEPLVDKATVARHLSVEVRSVDNYMKRGILPYYKFGRSVRFKLSDVDAVANERFRVDARAYLRR